MAEWAGVVDSFLFLKLEGWVFLGGGFLGWVIFYFFFGGGCQFVVFVSFFQERDEGYQQICRGIDIP